MSKVLENKIDFVALVKVENANPNGDPLNGNRPRATFSQFGEMSDVCIKRKIRNRLQDMNENIFVQSADRCDDGMGSLSERASANIKEYNSADEYSSKACERWIDVRSFGQVFAFKGMDKGAGVSVGVRGPVSVHNAMSVHPIMIKSMQITKSVNGDPSEGRASDTMGQKHFVEFGLYKVKGSINVQLAEKTGFTEEDAEKIKEALKTLFVNDVSAARPEGSLEVVKLYWFKHNNKIGQYSTSKVHNMVDITLKNGKEIPESLDDYVITLNKPDDLACEETEEF